MQCVQQIFFSLSCLYRLLDVLGSWLNLSGLGSKLKLGFVCLPLCSRGYLQPLLPVTAIHYTQEQGKPTITQAHFKSQFMSYSKASHWQKQVPLPNPTSLDLGCILFPSKWGQGRSGANICSTGVESPIHTLIKMRSAFDFLLWFLQNTNYFLLLVTLRIVKQLEVF